MSRSTRSCASGSWSGSGAAGDLEYLRPDGVNGRNLYPHDIEREAAEVHPVFAALPSCVFSVPGRQGEVIVLVQEVRARGLSETDLHGYARRAKSTLSARLGVRVPHVVFVRPGQVLRTTSGKIQRRRMREDFLAGELQPLYADLDPHA